jgi:hypothetical protein
MEKETKAYEKYRWFFTSSGKLVIGGKNAEQNEQIMKSTESDDYVLHTASPGSPFCIIKNPSKKDLEETAIFTGSFSHDWKNKKKKADVHVFKGGQVKKAKNMKTGTFGVSGKIETIRAELKLALDFQKGKLRAIPLSTAKKPIAVLTPGEMSKEKAAEKIAEVIKEKLCYPIKKEEILQAIPSDKIRIQEK